MQNTIKVEGEILRLNLCIRSALCLAIILIICKPLQLVASGIVGDINNNGRIGLEEGIYSLQVAAGMSPATLLDSSSGPRCAAWGTFTYASNILAGEFTFSTFMFNGPEVGSFRVSVAPVTSTEMTLDNDADLKDVILALKIAAGQNPAELRTDYSSSGVDVNDGQAGLTEAVYVLKKIVE